jgi:glycerophosphoryl diester phosphodiesterase
MWLFVQDYTGRNMSSLFIVAHRGGKGPHEENTLEALKYGLEQCGNAVEMDVRFDHWRKRFYLEHDFIHSPRKNFNVIDKVIPFLPTTATLFVELKTLYWIRRKYAIHFIKVIEEFALDQRAIIMSFNPFVLVQLKSRAPYLHTGFLMNSRIWGFICRHWLYWLLKPQYLMINCRLFRKNRFIERMMDFAREHKIKVLTFTANSPEDWYNAKEHKFDGVITDYPKEACEIMVQHDHHQKNPSTP